MNNLPCCKCGKKATKRFSPDLDIQGIGSCDDCLESVRLAYAALLQGSADNSENIGAQMVEGWQKKLKKRKESDDK